MIIPYDLLIETIYCGTEKLITGILEYAGDNLYYSEAPNGYPLTFAIMKDRWQAAELLIKAMDNPLIVFDEWTMLNSDLQKTWLLHKLLELGKITPDDIIQSIGMTVFEFAIAAQVQLLIKKCISMLPVKHLLFPDYLTCARYYCIPESLYNDIQLYLDTIEEYPQVGQVSMIKINNKMVECRITDIINDFDKRK